MRVSDWKWMDIGERVVMRLAIFGIFLLLIVQLLLFFPELRPFISYVDRLEGDPIYPGIEGKGYIISTIMELLH